MDGNVCAYVWYEVCMCVYMLVYMCLFMYVGYSVSRMYKQALDQTYNLFGTKKETVCWLTLPAGEGVVGG